MKREQRRRRKKLRKKYFKRFPDAIGWNVRNAEDVINILSDHLRERTDCPAMFTDIYMDGDNPIIVAPKQFHAIIKKQLHHVPILPQFVVLDAKIKENEDADSITEGDPRPGSIQRLVRRRKG